MGFDPSEARNPHSGEWIGHGGGVTDDVSKLVDMKRVRQWQQQPIATVRKYLTKNLTPKDRAELEMALARKTAPKKKPVGTALASDEKAKAWEKEHYGEWEGSLSNEQRAVVRSYTSSKFCYRVNKSLRLKHDLNAEDAAKAKALDDVISSAPPTPEDMRVFRSMRLPKGFSIDHLKGKTITDDGFSSTSVTESVAIRNFGGDKPLAVISVPKGMKAAFFGPTMNNKNFDENELLLPRGTKFKVTNVTDRAAKNGQPALVVVHMTVVRDGS